MKIRNAIPFVLFTVASFFAGVHWSDLFKSTSQTSVTPTQFVPLIKQTPLQTIVRYGEFEGEPVELVVNRLGGTAVLRVHHAVGSGKDFLPGTTEYLKAEVEKFVTAKKPVRLGQTGKTFEFTGGYPIWGPHSSYVGDEGHDTSLYFADGVTIAGDAITGKGPAEMGKGYYPYVLTMN
jgi:hypothetical protein